MKYNAIGDLIDENMELKRLLRKEKIDSLKGMISFLELAKPALEKIKGAYNFETHLSKVKAELNKYETLEQ